jgi:hypothetical protein
LGRELSPPEFYRKKMDASLCAAEFPGVRFRMASIESAAKFS